jgi:hypothetical protein
MAQVWKVRLPGGQTYTPGDWTASEPLWSTVELTTGAVPVLSAFSYGRGADVPGSIGPRQSDFIDTNLEGEGGRLPENEELVIFSMAVEVFKIGAAGQAGGVDAIPATDAPDFPLLDMLRLQRDMIVVMRIAYVKEYTRAPLGYFPASTGVARMDSGSRTVISAGVSGTVVGNNGSTNVMDNRVFSSPLYVAGGESFTVDFRAGPGQINNIDLNANTGRARLRVFLEGYRRRPVA